MLSDKNLIILFIAIVLVAAFLRLYALDLRPVHFDEGGGYAIGARELFKTGVYHYNPDFHGPFLFHITALSFHLFGMSDISLRLMEAIFGIGLVLLLYPLIVYLKNYGFLFAALFIAISPSLVYYSKFAVHDSFYVFFNLAVITSLFLYLKYKKKIYLFLFAISFALLFSTKENSYVFLAIFTSWLFVEFIYSFLTYKKGIIKGLENNIFSIFSNITKNISTISICAALFILTFSAIFTLYFKYPADLGKSIVDPLFHWFKRSTTDVGGFYRPYTFYLQILSNYELPIFLLGLAGIFVVLKENNKFTRFVSIWTILTLIIYLYMPYKLPNNVIHVVLPFAISAGVFVGFLLNKLKGEYFKYGVIVLLILSAYMFYISIDINFVKYCDEPNNLLVYVQTVDDVKGLLKLMDNVSIKKGKDIDMIVSVFQTEYPLSWYFRDYPNVRYYAQKIETVDGWEGINWKGDGILTWATDQAKDGTRSIKIRAEKGANANWWEKISVNKGCYELNEWVKTKGVHKVSDGGKFASVEVRKDLNNAPGDIIAESPEMWNDNDWTKVNISFCVDSDQSLWISNVLANWGEANGTMWFDGLSLKSTTEGDQTWRINNLNFEKGFKFEDFNASIIIVSETNGQTLEDMKGYDMRKFTLRPTVVLAAYFRKGLLD
jgi:uncharacterized protein (TIGR03663 family)